MCVCMCIYEVMVIELSHSVYGPQASLAAFQASTLYVMKTH